ncbi:MAG: elongation factor P [Xanthomonadaceae bacterium]|nr:elongation factor P [Rhodospirillaceae bacterium]NIA18145.1 elongation factor P [Xanthomonadaceae bacterium]
MLNFNEIKLGSIVKFNNEPYVVTFAQHLKMGRGGAILKTKLKNLINGNVLEYSLKGSDKMEEAELKKIKASFLYKEKENYFFMDENNFEQFFLNKNILGDKIKFLKEGIITNILNFEKKPVAIELPPKIELKVISAPPGIKGDTAQGGTKAVTVETGAIINAPLFINNNDIIRVNTETGEYVERV